MDFISHGTSACSVYEIYDIWPNPTLNWNNSLGLEIKVSGKGKVVGG